MIILLQCYFDNIYVFIKCKEDWVKKRKMWVRKNRKKENKDKIENKAAIFFQAIINIGCRPLKALLSGWLLLFFFRFCCCEFFFFVGVKFFFVKCSFHLMHREKIHFLPISRNKRKSKNILAFMATEIFFLFWQKNNLKTKKCPSHYNVRTLSLTEQLWYSSCCRLYNTVTSDMTPRRQIVQPTTFFFNIFLFQFFSLNWAKLSQLSFFIIINPFSWSKEREANATKACCKILNNITFFINEPENQK